MTLNATQNCVIIEVDVEKHPLFELITPEKQETGVVISAGLKCEDLRVGDRVYFGVGQEFTHEGKSYIVMREDHVIGVLENE